MAEVDANLMLLKYQKVLCNWYHQNSLIFYWQHIFYVCWTYFLTYLAFLRIPTVFLFLFLTTCSFICMKQIDFIQGLLKKIIRKLAWFSNFTFYYIDDVLSLSNSKNSIPTFKPAYKGHSREPENMVFMSGCPLDTG
jgi:hypothetical protein